MRAAPSSGVALSHRMKKIFATMLCAASALAINAIEPITIPLWGEGEMPGNNGFTRDDEHVEGVMEVNIAVPELIVYPADAPNGPAVVACPGGGYYGASMDHEGRDFAPWMNSRGVTYAVLRYRMPHGHSDIPLADAEQAMRIMRRRAGEWGVDTARIGIMGFSAGGHLASTVATHLTSADSRPNFQILFYPVISTSNAITHAGSVANLLGPNPDAKLLTLFSNELNVNASTPPAFIAACEDDATVPIENSLRYARALSDSGVRFDLHVYPIGGHGWGFRDSFPFKAQWEEALTAFLKSLE